MSYCKSGHESRDIPAPSAASRAAVGGGGGGGKGSGGGEINGGMDAATLIKFEESCQRLDLTRSKTGKPEDHTRILSAVKASSGLASMQRTVAAALRLSARCAMRWQGGLRGLALYLAVLLPPQSTPRGHQRG